MGLTHPESEQKCYRKNKQISYPCGSEATVAFKDMIEGKTLSCKKNLLIGIRAYLLYAELPAQKDRSECGNGFFRLGISVQAILAEIYKPRKRCRNSAERDLARSIRKALEMEKGQTVNNKALHTNEMPD